MICDGVFLFCVIACDWGSLRKWHIFPHDFASLQDMDDEILPFVPMTWMSSQWLGCCPRWGNIQNCRSCCTQCSNLKKGRKKHSQQNEPKKNLEAFFAQGMEILILAHMSSPIHHVTVTLYDFIFALYILFARTNRNNAIRPVYESAFNGWS